MVDISGLEKADVLAVLYNAASPHGMGFLQTEHAPSVMRREDARLVIDERGDDMTQHLKRLRLVVTRHGHHSLTFRYVYGRPLKVDLSRDTFDESGYDQYHGAGAAAAAVAELRSAGSPMTAAVFQMHCDRLREQAAEVLGSPERFTELERQAGMGDFTERLVELTRRTLGGTAS